MKLRKITSVLAASAMCASVLSVFATSASAVTAGATSIDFEDGDCSFVYMNVDDAGSTDATLTVEDFNGSKALKIDPADYLKTPKAWFDLDKIMDRATATEIATIEMDISAVPVNAEEAVGWLGGQIGSAGGFDMNAADKGQVKPSWSSSDWSLNDGNNYNPGLTSTEHITKKFLLPSSRYSAEGTNPFFGVMTWGNGSQCDYVLYIDNVVFKNKAGDVLSIGVSAPAETEAAPAETTAAPAEETTAAPAEETTAAPAETTAAAPAVDYSALTGTVVAEGGSSDGSWGQAVVLQTTKNEGGVFDATLLSADKAVVVYYEADTAPELILQSWSGGAGWAKVPASELSTDGVAVFTYDYMTAMYEADNFVDTLDAVNIGDTGSALTVSKVMVVDAAALSAAPAETEAPATTAAPDASATTPTPTGNVPAAAMAVVMVASAAAAVIAKRK